MSKGKWTEEEVMLLGTEYDSAVAQKLERSRDSVAKKRLRLKISSYRESEGSYSRWTYAEIKLLSSKSTDEIVTMTGRSAHSVRLKRLEVNIRVGPKRRVFTTQEIRMLGTMPDSQLGKILNRSINSIWKKRTGLGIPPFSRKDVID